jgi:hypothetical protein
MMSSVLRWVKAKTGRAHLDLGERSSQSLRVQSDHVIVTACRAHLDPRSLETALNEAAICSNCLRIYRTFTHRCDKLSG